MRDMTENPPKKAWNALERLAPFQGPFQRFWNALERLAKIATKCLKYNRSSWNDCQGINGGSYPLFPPVPFHPFYRGWNAER